VTTFTVNSGQSEAALSCAVLVASRLEGEAGRGFQARDLCYRKRLELVSAHSAVANSVRSLADNLLTKASPRGAAKVFVLVGVTGFEPVASAV
jgi:hypothetical protein